MSATGTRTDQFQVSKKLNSYKGVLDFLICTYVQKLHTIAKKLLAIGEIEILHVEGLQVKFLKQNTS